MEHSDPKTRYVEDMVAELITRVAKPTREARQSVPSRMRVDRLPRIDDAAIELLERLPAALRLVGLRGQFPRLLNRIAHAWPEPLEFAALMDSLMIDDRGNREGFPFEVVKEITELRRYYFTMVRPEWHRKLGDAGPRGFR